MATPNTPLWEVFIRSRNGLAHKHCGSLHAEDATLAIQAARDICLWRDEAGVFQDAWQQAGIQLMWAAAAHLPILVIDATFACQVSAFFGRIRLGHQRVVIILRGPFVHF